MTISYHCHQKNAMHKGSFAPVSYLENSHKCPQIHMTTVKSWHAAGTVAFLLFD